MDKFVQLIKAGEVVAFPTETVYGLGADAWNASAIKKVFDIKGRPSDNPLIVHISNREMIAEFAEDVSEEAEQLIEAFWPGPLTLIFNKKPAVLDLITAGLPTVALRWPDNELALQFINQTGPLVAPSANSSGRPSPTKTAHIKDDFGEDFPIIDGGETNIGLESTVLDVSEKPFRIYRPGAIGQKEIEAVADVSTELSTGVSGTRKAKSPGTKYSHYSPEAKVRWLKSEEKPDSSKTLYLFHHTDPGMVSDHIIFYRNNYDAMAKELYDRFRQADLKQLDAIAVEPFPADLLEEMSIAKALENRIQKAMG